MDSSPTEGNRSLLAGTVDLSPDRLLFNGEVNEFPPASKEEAAAPLGRPPVTVPDSDHFTFMSVRADSDAPVAYDPCRPIHVVVNARTAPPVADVMLDEALEAVHVATGLQFIRDGATDEVPSRDRRPYQPERYPKRWAPVLLAWSDPLESAALAGTVAGNGGSVAVSRGPDRLYVTGAVTLDGPQIAQLLHERNGQARARAVLEHELGHLVGLDHVPYATEVMNPTPTAVSLGAGDLAGLAALGRGRCVPGM